MPHQRRFIISKTSDDLTLHTSQTHSPLGALSPRLEENILCLCLDTFEERLFAGGDGGLVRCWDTKTLKEIPGLADDFALWNKKMQGGGLSAYSMIHYDPNEERQRRLRMKRGFLEGGNEDLDSGRGNLVLGNLNGDVVVWDLEARGVSAVLVGGRQDEYIGACNAVSIVKRGGGGRERIVGLSGDGRGVCIWPSKDVWDAIPEVEGR